MPLETVFPLNGKRVWVAGHRGMVGSAIVRRLAPDLKTGLRETYRWFLANAAAPA